MMWEDCDHCDDGSSHHDCGDDTCCCLDPYPNVECEWCDGTGGFYVCGGCQIRLSPSEMKRKEMKGKSP